VLPPCQDRSRGVVHVSWWEWLIVAWLLISLPFALLTAKFIAAGRERAKVQREPEILIDLTAPEPAEPAPVPSEAQVPEPVEEPLPGLGPSASAPADRGDRARHSNDPARSV
jgi:hypothetical protein